MMPNRARYGIRCGEGGTNGCTYDDSQIIEHLVVERVGHCDLQHAALVADGHDPVVLNDLGRHA